MTTHKILFVSIALILACGSNDIYLVPKDTMQIEYSGSDYISEMTLIGSDFKLYSFRNKFGSDIKMVKVKFTVTNTSVQIDTFMTVCVAVVGDNKVGKFIGWKPDGNSEYRGFHYPLEMQPGEKSKYSFVYSVPIEAKIIEFAVSGRDLVVIHP